jgi:hypothetical protein
MTEQNKELQTMGDNKPAEKAPQVNYIMQILDESKREFVEVNVGMDLDYVRVGEWLKLNKKGNYVESGDENVSYGDKVDVVVGMGEQRYMLWGKDKSPEKGQLIVAEKTMDEAKEVLGGWLAENPEAAERYVEGDIALRYLAYIVPVETLSPDEPPRIYIFDFPPGDTIGWGKFAKAIFDGKYKALGIPRKTPVNRVVIRFTSEERKNADNETYLGTKFEPVGLFNPADYGIAE